MKVGNLPSMKLTVPQHAYQALFERFLRGLIPSATALQYGDCICSLLSGHLAQYSDFN